MVHLWNIVLILISFEFSNLTEGFISNNARRDWDICSYWNGRRRFLELGVRGDLHARNVSASNYRSNLHTFEMSPMTENSTVQNIWYQCNLELVTCAECVIRITFTYTNFSKLCVQHNRNNDENTTFRCPCEHVMFSEPPYDTKTSGQDFCGDGKVFRSQTRTLLLRFYFRATYSHVFSLQYISERNVKVISGSPKQSRMHNISFFQPKVISTPYFPIHYPRDYGVEHILTCESEDCHVRLEFTDFQLGLTSTMEIFDSNGQMLDSYNGEHFRPPVIISSGKSLLLQFRGNGVTGIGYRAEITFISSRQINNVLKTDCGGMVESYGGAITMMNMNENDKEFTHYDCIWIIKPGNNYMMMKTHIALRVSTFSGLESNSQLVIREGTTSKGTQLETLESANDGLNSENHIAPVVSGFYIRLKGGFKKSSRLAIAYSVFNYISCYIGSEFLCDNNHCISIRLHCDGFDHCGDGSDELANCEKNIGHIQKDGTWYTQKANYYFPKIENYSADISIATTIWSIGVLSVLSGWMVLLYRMGIKARHQRAIQSHLQTITQLLDRQEENPPPSAPGGGTSEEPPVYDAPPDYEDVMKFETGNEISQSRVARYARRQRQRKLSRNPNELTGPTELIACTLTRNSPADGGTTSSNQSNRQVNNFQSVVKKILNTDFNRKVLNRSSSDSDIVNSLSDSTLCAEANEDIFKDSTAPELSLASSAISSYYEDCCPDETQASAKNSSIRGANRPENSTISRRTSVDDNLTLKRKNFKHTLSLPVFNINKLIEANTNSKDPVLTASVVSKFDAIFSNPDAENNINGLNVINKVPNKLHVVDINIDKSVSLDTENDFEIIEKNQKDLDFQKSARFKRSARSVRQMLLVRRKLLERNLKIEKQNANEMNNENNFVRRFSTSVEIEENPSEVLEIINETMECNRSNSLASTTDISGDSSKVESENRNIDESESDHKKHLNEITKQNSEKEIEEKKNYNNSEQHGKGENDLILDNKCRNYFASSIATTISENLKGSIVLDSIQELKKQNGTIPKSRSLNKIVIQNSDEKISKFKRSKSLMNNKLDMNINSESEKNLRIEDSANDISTENYKEFPKIKYARSKSLTNANLYEEIDILPSTKDQNNNSCCKTLQKDKNYGILEESSELEKYRRISRSQSEIVDNDRYESYQISDNVRNAFIEKLYESIKVKKQNSDKNTITHIKDENKSMKPGPGHGFYI